MERKHFIDWVRVIAFFLLIFFHCAMPFVSFGWEIKNAEQSIGLSRLIFWLHQWRLPLLFFIAGVGIHFSLKSRSVPSFAGERVVRLFIPLLFAMFFTIPFQPYFEFLQKGRITGSFLQFYPQVWELVPYPDGALTWSHMWFVVYLFVFCLLLIPVFAVFKIGMMQSFKTWLSNLLSGPVAVPLLCLPLVLYYFTLFIEYPEQQSLLDDWFLFIFSITLVVYGYVLGGSERFWQTCSTYRFYYLGTALVCMVILFYRYWWAFDIPKQYNATLYAYGALSAVHIWMLILSALGFAKKHLNVSNRFLQFANEAVYPFYILHQTIIVAAGYYIVQWKLPIWPKMMLLMAITFTSLYVLYKYLIQPFKLTRILYGLKAVAKPTMKP